MGLYVIKIDVNKVDRAIGIVDTECLIKYMLNLISELEIPFYTGIVASKSKSVMVLDYGYESIILNNLYTYLGDIYYRLSNMYSDISELFISDITRNINHIAIRINGDKT